MTPAPDARTLALHAEAMAALPGDPFVRWDVDPGPMERVLASPGRAVAILTRHASRGVRWVTALAADETVPEHAAAAVELAVALARDVQDGEPLEGLTVPAGSTGLVPPDLQPVEWAHWDAWSTETVPDLPERAFHGPLEVLDADRDDPRIPLLLDLASPSAPVRPGDTRVARWAVVPDPDGDLADTGGLAAMLALTRLPSGAAHLNDVATHPARRGRGIARTLCGVVTAQALRGGYPAVTLGMYSSNDAARPVYESLGFVRSRSCSSGSFA